MGHLVNPKLFRLKYVIPFSLQSISLKKHSSFFDLKIYRVYSFLNLYFKRYNKNIKNKILLYIYNFKVSFKNKNVVIFLNFKKSSLLRKRIFFKIRKIKRTQRKFKHKIRLKKYKKKFLYKKNYNSLLLFKSNNIIYFENNIKRFKYFKLLKKFKNVKKKFKIFNVKKFSLKNNFKWYKFKRSYKIKKLKNNKAGNKTGSKTLHKKRKKFKIKLKKKSKSYKVKKSRYNKISSKHFNKFVEVLRSKKYYIKMINNIRKSSMRFKYNLNNIFKIKKRKFFSKVFQNKSNCIFYTNKNLNYAFRKRLKHSYYLNKIILKSKYKSSFKFINYKISFKSNKSRKRKIFKLDRKIKTENRKKYSFFFKFSLKNKPKKIKRMKKLYIKKFIKYSWYTKPFYSRRTLKPKLNKWFNPIVYKKKIRFSGVLLNNEREKQKNKKTGNKEKLYLNKFKTFLQYINIKKIKKMPVKINLQKKSIFKIPKKYIKVKLNRRKFFKKIINKISYKKKRVVYKNNIKKFFAARIINKFNSRFFLRKLFKKKIWKKQQQANKKVVYSKKQRVRIFKQDLKLKKNIINLEEVDNLLNDGKTSLESEYELETSKFDDRFKPIIKRIKGNLLKNNRKLKGFKSFIIFNLKYKFLITKLRNYFVSSIIKFFEFKPFLKIFFLIRKSWGSLKTADMFSEALIIQLLRKKKISDVARSAIFFLKKYCYKKRIIGYSMLLTGRFTRKDRAMYKWHKQGRYSRSNKLIFIDYSNKRVALKYSSCSFKISIINYRSQKIEFKL